MTDLTPCRRCGRRSPCSTHGLCQRCHTTIKRKGDDLKAYAADVRRWAESEAAKSNADAA